MYPLELRESRVNGSKGTGWIASPVDTPLGKPPGNPLLFGVCLTSCRNCGLTAGLEGARVRTYRIPL